MAKKKTPKPNAPYEIPPLKIKPGKLILACDPGSRNFGLSLVGVADGKVTVYANTVLMTPVNNLVNFNQAAQEFLAEIDHWMQFKPNAIIAERFQTRGNGGPLIEMVSSMLGLMKGKYSNLPMKLTVASAWKNKFNRRFDADLKEIYPTVAVQPHQLDATLIGIYGLEQGMKADIAYDYHDIISQTEATSLLGLRKIRKD
jgi:hypothetical protein